MRRNTTCLYFLVFALCLPANVWSQQPELPENVQQFWAKLAKAKTLTFTAQVWDWEQHKEIAPRPYKRLRQTFEVKIQRPNRMAVVGSPALVYEIPPDKNTGTEFRTIGALSNTQISDGRRSLLLDTVNRAYSYAPQIRTLDDIVDDGGAPSVHLRLNSLFLADPMKDFLRLPASHPRAEYGLTYSLSLSDDRQKGEEHYVFDKDTGQLMTWSYWDLTVPGEEAEVERVTFRNWDFDPPLPRATFDTRIPRGYKTMQEWLKELEARRTKGK